MTTRIQDNLFKVLFLTILLCLLILQSLIGTI
jgi:hypothetical protein